MICNLKVSACFVFMVLQVIAVAKNNFVLLMILAAIMGLF
jgi:hypothetical protein